MNRIESPFTMTKHGRGAAALFAAVLAFAGLANVNAVASDHSHKAKKGHFTITSATEVGEITLPAGDYQVKEVNSPSGAVVEFVHLFTDYTVGDSGRSLYNQEVVGQVNATEKALSSLPKETQLIFASNDGEATGLEIRGSEVAYEFPTAQMDGAAKTQPSAISMPAGQQQ